MKYTNSEQFNDVNIFGKGQTNDSFKEFFTGESYINPLVDPLNAPLFMANITFEPKCRNYWHIHNSEKGGGQILVCTAGEGWYQAEGKKAISLSEGSIIFIPAGIKHWHGAKNDSWFSHISIDVPGEKKETIWKEAVSEYTYNLLNSKKTKHKEFLRNSSLKDITKKDFDKSNIFGTGMYNFMLKKYFSGKSYLKMLMMPGKSGIFMANVSFEPSCRNNWHIHHATKNGGQVLICTTGEGWYQEEGKEAETLLPGTIKYIPAGVKHWHGAKKDSWFSHIAMELPGENSSNEWLEKVDDYSYSKL